LEFCDEKESTMYRLLTLCLAALALGLFVASPGLADNQKAADKDNPTANKDNTHEGKFLMAEGNDKFSMTDKAGSKHEHMLARDAKVTCDGKECKIADLKEGIRIRVTTAKDNKDMAVRVEALTKGDFDNPKPENK
jgi:hypothetical protein